MRPRTLPAVVALFALAAPTLAQPDPAEPEQAGQNAEDDAPGLPAIDSLEKALPGVAIDLEAREVELDATVALQDGDWLELLACTPNSREHESILTIEARPSHVHLAMLLVDQEPGAPMRWERVEDEYVIHEPHGDLVSVFLVYENDDGETVEIPATEWIRHQPTGDAMAGNVWLFTGSTFERFEDQNLYMADVNGTVISLVNFGDDLLARPTKVTNHTDEQRWATFPDRVPEAGTKLKVRIRPFQGDEEDVTELVDQQQEQQDEVPPPPGEGHGAPPEDEE